MPPSQLKRSSRGPIPIASGVHAHRRTVRTRPTYAPLSDTRAQIIIETLEQIELIGGEEKALINSIAVKIDALTYTCNEIGKYLGIGAERITPTKVIPIENLSATLLLARPILAVIEHDAGSVTATHYDTEVFGVGETEFEALDDLKESLIEYYSDLSSNPDDLGPLPKKHFLLFSRLIKRT